MKILVLVAAIPDENSGRRKGKGSTATLVDRGLVDPNTKRNS